MNGNVVSMQSKLIMMNETNVVRWLSFLTLVSARWQAHVLKMLGDLPLDLLVLFLDTTSVCGRGDTCVAWT